MCANIKIRATPIALQGFEKWLTQRAWTHSDALLRSATRVTVGKPSSHTTSPHEGTPAEAKAGGPTQLSRSSSLRTQPLGGLASRNNAMSALKANHPAPKSSMEDHTRTHISCGANWLCHWCTQRFEGELSAKPPQRAPLMWCRGCKCTRRLARATCAPASEFGVSAAAARHIKPAKPCWRYNRPSGLSLTRSLNLRVKPKRGKGSVLQHIAPAVLGKLAKRQGPQRIVMLAPRAKPGRGTAMVMPRQGQGAQARGTMVRQNATASWEAPEPNQGHLVSELCSKASEGMAPPKPTGSGKRQGRCVPCMQLTTCHNATQ